MQFRLHRDGDEKKPTRYYSSIQEKKVAKAVEGKTTSNSGATPFQKGDVISSDWLIECKTKASDTTQKSISVKKAWFDKNFEESMYMMKQYSAVVISFGLNSPNYYIIDENTFQEMKYALERMKEYDNADNN